MSKKTVPDDDTYPIPEKVKTLVDNHLNGKKNVNIILAQQSDIKLCGFFGESWLVVTEEQVFIVEPDQDEIVLALWLRELQEVRVRHLYGNGIIEIRANEQIIDLLQFSRSYADKMEDTARELAVD